MSFESIFASIKNLEPMILSGAVKQVIGTIIEGSVPDCSIGTMCEIYPDKGNEPINAEVVGFKNDNVILLPFGDMRGIRTGSKIVTKGAKPSTKVGEELLGRVVSALGEPIDGKGPVNARFERSIYADPINPFVRQRISKPLDLGIKCINCMLTCGIGQRVAIMAGSGVGKSVLLGMMARNTTADINVIGLVGERGRELKEFIERDLGEEGLKRSVVVAATSDTAPLERVRAAFLATTYAEYFRDQGKTVLLMMDSATRFAMAQREIGLAIGEPPTTKGYTPSVFALLPKLLERAGMSGGAGSITGLYTVLVEGDDMNDPIGDSIRSIVDGHIVLSRDLADKNHFPAIDVLASKSRVMVDIITKEHRALSAKTQRLIAAYRKAETLINIGAYAKGSNPEIDEAIDRKAAIDRFLQQDIFAKTTFEQSLNDMKSIFIK